VEGGIWEKYKPEVYGNIEAFLKPYSTIKNKKMQFKHKLY
jgi:hypothetical protein